MLVSFPVALVAGLLAAMEGMGNADAVPSLVAGVKAVNLEGWDFDTLKINLFTEDASKGAVGGRNTMWHSSEDYYIYWCNGDTIAGIPSEPGFNVGSKSVWHVVSAGLCLRSLAFTDGARKDDLFAAEYWKVIRTNSVDVFLRNDAVRATVASCLTNYSESSNGCEPCAPTVFTYTPGEWSTLSCGKEQSRTETESCGAAAGCSCSNQRAATTETRAGPCCTVDYAYSTAEWSNPGCGKEQSRTETESCDAAAGCSCSNQRAATTETRAGLCCAGEYAPSNIGGACKLWRGNCKLNEFQYQSPSPTQDRVCKLVTECTENQREIAEPTLTSDRQCGDTTSTTTVTTTTITTSSTVTSTSSTTTLNATDLLAMNITVADLRNEGKGIAELLFKGFTGDELVAAGFDEAEVRRFDAESSTRSQKNGSKSSGGAIIGAAIGGLLGVALLAVSSVVVWRRCGLGEALGGGSGGSGSAGAGANAHMNPGFIPTANAVGKTPVKQDNSFV
jgi:hypothetical protein